jgi:hypothetical protein
MTEKGWDFREFYRNNEKSIIQFTILILMSAAIINPIGLPLPITSHPVDLFNYVETFGPETKIICAFNIPVGYMGDINPGAIAMFHHLFRLGVQLYIVGFNVDGVMVVLENHILPKANPEDYGYVYGEDWVNLGYVAGGDIAWSTFAAEIRSAVQYDKKGTSIDDIPMMEGIETLTDFDIILEIGGDYAVQTVSFWADPYKLPYITVHAIGPLQRTLEPFYRSGQLKEFIAGVTMGAEYEKLVGVPGRALATIDALSLSISFLLIMIIGGNILFLMTGGWGKRRV